MTSQGRLLSVALSATQTLSYSYDPAGNILNQTSGGSADTDQDQLPDDWEQSNFQSLAQEAADDFDMDGFTELEEYRAGTDPKNSSSKLAILAFHLHNGAGLEILVSTVPGKTYLIQSKNALSESWRDRDLLPAAEQTASWVDPEAASEARFYRVAVLP